MKDKSFAEKPAESGKKSVVVGLDIGTTKIACFVGVKNDHGKIEIISRGKSESLGVKKGVVFNIDKTINSIRAAIEDTEQNCKDGNLKLSHVVWVLPDSIFEACKRATATPEKIGRKKSLKLILRLLSTTCMIWS